MSPVTSDMGGFIDDPMLTNLLPGSYVAVTELVADETTVKSITFEGSKSWLGTVAVTPIIRTVPVTTSFFCLKK